MLALLARVCFLLLVCLIAGRAKAADVLAYYTYDKSSAEAFRSQAKYFNQVAMDLCSVTEKGVVSGAVPVADLGFAHAQHMAAFATVSNYAGSDFNAHIAHAIVTSPACTQTFLDGMLAKLKLGHYEGINIDFESISAADRDAFSAFVGTVAKQMKAAGYLTMVSVPAKQVDDPTNSWDGAFDYKALGAAADVIQVMTYDENGPWGKPGPVAGLDWVELCIKFAASKVAPGKINMGIPAFGYDWDLIDSKQSRQISWTKFQQITASLPARVQWDESSSSPHLRFGMTGQLSEYWGENERSIGLKMKLVAKYHLQGISIYALGMEDDAFWRAIQAGL